MYHSSYIVGLGDSIPDPIDMRVKKLVHSVRIIIHYKLDRNKTITGAIVKFLTKRLMRGHKQNIEDISEVPDFINLDRRELLLHFYKEPEGHYKDIIE
jgi:hypothetical protein